MGYSEAIVERAEDRAEDFYRNGYMAKNVRHIEKITIFFQMP